VTSMLHPDRLERHGPDWVEAGLLSDTQLEAIIQFESDQEGAARRFPVSTEVAVYLGSVLALLGGAVVVRRSWQSIAFAGRLGVAMVIASVGLIAGAWMYRQHEPGADRLGGFLTGVGLGGIALTVGVIVDRIDPAREEVVPLAVGLSLLVAGVIGWQDRDRPVELLVASAGFVVATLAGGSLLDAPPWVGGIWLIAVGGVIAFAGAIDRVTPAFVATAIGGAMAFGGAFMLTDANRHLGPVVALAVALVVVAHAVRASLVALLVLGVVGALIATQALLATTFTGAVSSMVVTLLGLTTVVTAIVRSRRPT
jgi:hypothetical protein